MSTPINKKNAIELISFFLIFERDFNQAELQSLARLEQVFKEEFPIFKTLNAISVNIENNSVIGSHEDASGVLLQSFGANGKPRMGIED